MEDRRWPGASMQIWRLLATIGFSLATSASWGQATRGADTERALKQLEQSVGDDGIPASVHATIIDKPRIAEATLERVVGLREAKNPHIQRGEGLLLGGIQDNPAVSRVDLEALRQERIAMYEGTIDKLSPPPPSSPRLQPKDQAPAPTAPGPAPRPRPERSRGGLILAGLIFALSCTGGYLVWKQSRKP